MELIDRLREFLGKEYGITSDEELMQAIEAQHSADIGIFVSPCGTAQREGKASA